MEFHHTSVLLEPSLDHLAVRPDGIYVDGTLGGGGHSFHIAERLASGGRLIGIDRDEEAIRAASERLSPYRDRVTIVKDNYGNIRDVLNSLEIPGVDGILLDLGVSSHQLDTAERGFSYMADAPLDMRMDQEEQKTARDIVNEYSEEELYRMIRDYGEDRFARSIARRITKEREQEPIETTGQLVHLIEQAIPRKVQKTGGHPAKRTFQALRIELNRELTILDEVIETMIDCLNPGGRLCIITFHSLEDRIVKGRFRTAEDPCICPKNFPVCVCGRKSKGRVVTRKPVLPGEQEMEENPRAKSAKLRVFEKTEEDN
ncbi:16S rRNA (cytosine(1402)-N(4))-methyltransferase RsmH [Cuneatibacter sp. NSJ-177]|uniref:16S rRNA (cytosine(1402)-N(4))-methyltransferase RsmH n=1 Tax=Cuneatibacter sp. NSJ-177 TaxID=2931401 RepID=UPI001FD49AA5|nr:16S rRNA (cytosine(1402)-N(4))-methyltransferase RsmH [Cuneatibacter sp. NSJ-177]MCJ7835949.1 16S rRNA (cytosine(1402)-N(4))-methyltransferase RsmH [Cuneatibacter sp. NSJ-177]